MDNNNFNDDYGVSLPEELLNLDDPEKLIREGDDTPDTPKKRRTNWMNRNMPYMMGALALLLVVGTLLYTAVLKGGPDYIVGLVTSYTMPEPGRKQLEQLLASYADDRNGDGVVVVDLKAYSFVPNSSDVAQREEAELDMDAALIGREVLIFLGDEAALQEIGDKLDGVLLYADGTPMPAGARDFGNAMLPWTSCKGLSSFEPDPDRLNMWDPQIYLELCEGMGLSLRAEDEQIEGDPEMAAYYDSCAAFVERLRTGEKPVLE